MIHSYFPVPVAQSKILKDTEDTHRVKEAQNPIFSLKNTAGRYKVQKALNKHYVNWLSKLEL